jgi:carboxylesterase type B
MSSSPQVDVPGYGKVSGIVAPTIKDGSVIEFRGVPFGKISARFQKPVLYEKLEAPHDGSKYGPMCPSVPIEVVLNDNILDLIAPPPEQEQDEFECLNLNISVPKDALKAGKTLPVLVWIYGGAFIMGANTNRYAAIASLCKQSIEIGKPMIVVAINYRLGYLGFLASKELQEGNVSAGGGAGNWGLFDQRVALEWVQRNISAFGGDPDAVTAMGHSAGSLSIHGHLLVGKPLFRGAILASGIWGVLGPKPVEHLDVQGEYDQLIKYLGSKDLEELRTVPIDKLMAAHHQLHPGFPVAQVVDDSHIKGGFFTLGRKETSDYMFNPDSANIPVMVGDTETEGIIFAALFQHSPPEKVLSSLQKRLPASYLKEYGLDSDSAPPSSSSIEQLLPRFIALCSDTAFSCPIARFCENYPGPVYSYHFDRPNQWEGPLKGIANHGVDMSYVFGGHYPYFKDDLDRHISQTWMGYVISFVNGETPWPAREKGENKSMVVGADGKIEVQDTPITRRWSAYKEQLRCWDDVKEVWTDLLAVRL